MKEYDADGIWVERGQYLRIGVDSGDGKKWDKYGGIFQVKVIVLGEVLKIMGMRIWKIRLRFLVCTNQCIESHPLWQRRRTLGKRERRVWHVYVLSVAFTTEWWICQTTGQGGLGFELHIESVGIVTKTMESDDCLLGEFRK